MRGRRSEVLGRGRAKRNEVKDHRSSYRKNPPLHHRSSRRSLSPRVDRQRGPRRSLTPLTTRPRRSSPRQSPPIEQLYTMRRSEQHENRHWPNSLVDNNEDNNFQHNYMLPEHPTNFSDVHSLLKPSRAGKDKDIAGSSSLGIDNQGMLVQRSLLMDDGSKRTFYTLSQDTGRPPFDSTTSLNPSSDNLRSIRSGGSLNVGMSRYDQRLGDLYDDKEREKFYPKDGSFSEMPPSRPFVGTSSSSFSKDADLLPLYGDRSGVGKFLDDPLEYNGYNPVQLSDCGRRAPLSPRPRVETLDYGYDEPIQRGRSDHGYLPSDYPYRKREYGLRSEFRDLNDSSFMDPSDGRADRADTYHKKISEGNFWGQQHAVRKDATMGFRDLKGFHEDDVVNSGVGYVGVGPKASRDYDRPTFEESDRFGIDVDSVAYRKRPSSPLLADRPFRVSPPRERARMDVDTFDLSPERRMLRRNHVMLDDMDGRSVHRRIHSPIHGDEMWTNKEYEPIEESRQVLHSKKRAAGRSNHRPPSHKPSRNDGWGVPRDSIRHMDGRHGTSLKRRLRLGPTKAHGSFTVERKEEYFRPHNVWERGQECRNISLNIPDEDVPVDAAHPVKRDPPEDSEEFKTQVHKAFLRFSKLLNESPHQQKRFRDDQGKSSKLLCCVCGSLSKEFSDIHSLLIHSYQTRKVGLRTEHLGLHKALCVLNEWNWLVEADTARAYKRSPPTEIKALKEDLILWPPVIIVHNISIGSKSRSNEPKVVTLERLEEILKEMGFDAGKVRVCRGKSANQSVLVVKFLPTLSGLQEAERLHKFYADKNQGRQGIQEITSSHGNRGEAQVEKDEFLYGYMAVVEDLDKLDPETKKRSLVKSKKDIKAVADAPLKID